MAAYTYILANKPYGTLYVGVTSDLVRRIYQRRTGESGGFTAKHGVKTLVHFELIEAIEDAIAREKVLKNWQRQWKKDLIDEHNPDWRDLYDEIVK